MREMIMNVTPAEFRDIWHTWNLVMDAHSEEAAIRYMESRYGCERFTHYRLVVQKRAVCIPMLSWDPPLLRFEPIALAEGGRKPSLAERRAAHGFPPLSDDERRENLEANLDALAEGGES